MVHTWSFCWKEGDIWQVLGIPSEQKPKGRLLRFERQMQYTGKEQKKEIVLSHLEQNKKVVRVYPLEDAEFVHVASMFHF